MKKMTEKQAYDVLTTALEGGYAEEFEVLNHERGTDSCIVKATLHCSEHDVEGVDTWTLEAKDVKRGADLFTAWVAADDPEHDSYLGSQFEEAKEEGWEYLDAIGADAVLQFACFGEVVFG